MEEPESITAVLDFGPAMLEKVLGVLQKVGIDLPILLVQIFLFIIVGLLFGWLLIKLWKAKKKPFFQVMGLVGLGLIMAGIVFSWVEQACYPLPGELTGVVEVADSATKERLADLRVMLLDYQGRKVSLEEGVVDTVDGRFVLSYPRRGDVPPRMLRLRLPGCKTQDFSLGRRELRQGRVAVHFACGGEP